MNHVLNFKNWAQINESSDAASISQPYGDVNPNSLKFKSDAVYQQSQKLVADANYTNVDQKAVLAGSLGEAFIKRDKSGQPIGLRDDFNASIMSIANAMWLTMVVNGFYGVQWANTIANTQTFSTKATNLIRKHHGNNSFYVPDGALQAITGKPAGAPFVSTTREEGMALALVAGRDDAKWQAIVKLVSPVLGKAIELALPKTATPTAAAKPGTAAPVKKN
jgi:hypothetical protein